MELTVFIIWFACLILTVYILSTVMITNVPHLSTVVVVIGLLLWDNSVAASRR